MKFYIMTIGDGYLFGGSFDPEQLERMATDNHEDMYTVYEMAETLPDNLREHCENQGTREQYFSDGYEGLREVVGYIKEVYYTNAEDPMGLRVQGAPEHAVRTCFEL